jgi:O-antigen/teichoic acid export membrane protein
LATVLGIVLWPILVVFARRFHPEMIAVPMVLLPACVVTGAVASIQAAGLQGAMGFRGLAFAGVLSAGTLCAGSLAVALSSGGVTHQFAVAVLAATVLVALQGMLLARHVAPQRPLPVGGGRSPLESVEFRQYWLSAAGLLAIEFVVWQRPEVFFLASYASAEELGYYNAAWALANRLVLLATLLAPVLQAQVAGMRYASEAQRLRELYSRSGRWLCLLAMPVFLLPAGLAGPIVRLLYGGGFEPAAAALAVLSLGGLVACVSVAGSAIVYGTDKIDFALRWGAVAAATTLLLNLLLIPRYGSIGAATANVTGQVVAVSATLTLALRPSGYRFPWAAALRALAAGTAAACVANFIAGSIPGSIGMLVAIAAGISTYVVAIVVSGSLQPDDWLLAGLLAPHLARRSPYVRAILTWALGPAPGDPR